MRMPCKAGCRLSSSIAMYFRPSSRAERIGTNQIRGALRGCSVVAKGCGSAPGTTPTCGGFRTAAGAGAKADMIHDCATVAPWIVGHADILIPRVLATGTPTLSDRRSGDDLEVIPAGPVEGAIRVPLLHQQVGRAHRI